MNPVVTDHLQAAVESVRLAIQEASNTETVLDIQKLLDLVVGLEELIPESYSQEFSYEDVVISDGGSSDTISFNGGYDYYNFDGGDYLIGSNSSDTIRLG